MFKRMFFILVCVLTGASMLSSCGNNAKPDDSGAGATEEKDVTEPEENDGRFCGYLFEISEGAKLENNVLSSETENDGFCGGYYEMPDQFSGEFTVTVTPHKNLNGGIMFKYADEKDYYRIEFNCKGGYVKVVLSDGGEVQTLDTEYCIIEKNVPVKVKVAYYNKSFKVFVYDTEDAGEYQKFDLRCEHYKPKGIFLDCGNGGMTFSDFSAGEYSYSLVDTEDKYANPLLAGADPFILYYDGLYYLYSTHKPSSGYVVYTSKNMKTWTDRGFCLQLGDVYGEPTSTGGYWAPEVYNVNGRFIMFYTVAGHIGVAAADLPRGPFKEVLGHYLFDYSAIDPNLFIDDDGQAYLYYVKCGNGNEIHGCRIDLNTFATSDDTLIITPKAGTWEFVEGKVAEGPCMIKHDGTYYLTFSCNGYTSKDYAIGYATSASPLKNFKRFEYNPILKKNETNGVYGPGHHSLFTTAGGQLMMVYHRHFSADSVHERQVCIDRCRFIRFPGEEIDRLVVTGPTSTVQALPK